MLNIIKAIFIFCSLGALVNVGLYTISMGEIPISIVGIGEGVVGISVFFLLYIVFNSLFPTDSRQALKNVFNVFFSFLPRKWQEKGKKMYEKLDERFKKNKFRKEIKFWSEIVKKYSDNPRPYAERAFLLTELEEYDKALKDYDKILELNKTTYWCFDEDIFKRKAIIYEKKKEYEKAIESWTKAIESTSARWLDFWYRGCLYERIGKFKLAYDDFLKAKESSLWNTEIREKCPGFIGMCCVKMFELDYLARQQREQEELEARFSKVSQN